MGLFDDSIHILAMILGCLGNNFDAGEVSWPEAMKGPPPGRLGTLPFSRWFLT